METIIQSCPLSDMVCQRGGNCKLQTLILDNLLSVPTGMFTLFGQQKWFTLILWSMNMCFVTVYNEKDCALYCHHDIILPAFPLSTAWINYDIETKSPGKLTPHHAGLWYTALHSPHNSAWHAFNICKDWFVMEHFASLLIISTMHALSATNTASVFNFLLIALADHCAAFWMSRWQIFCLYHCLWT